MSIGKLADENAAGIAEPSTVVAPELWHLRLYVAGETPRSLLTYGNLKSLCEVYLADRYRIEIVDLLEHPLVARHDEIVAVPTLVRLAPTPIVKIIGDLSNTQEVVESLRLGPGVV